jgi:putative endonuclease
VSRSTLGSFGESWATGHLTRLGYRIVERNVRYRVGEIDIVAWQDETLVFVEVKCRRTAMFGSPEESITRRRYSHLAGAIEEYLQRHDLEPDDYRIDVVSICVDQSGRVAEHRLLTGVAPPAG